MSGGPGLEPIFEDDQENAGSETQSPNSPHPENVNDHEEEVEMPFNMPPLNHQNALLFQNIQGLLQNSLAQQQIENEKMMNEKLASFMAENKTPHSGSNNKTNGEDTSQGKSKRVDFKSFRGCGAVEFTGKEEATEACTWLDRIETVIDVSNCWEIDIIKYVSGMLTERAEEWWKNMGITIGKDKQKAMPWTEFKERFITRFCPVDQQRKLEREFLELKQGTKSVAVYEAEFHTKSKFATQFVPTEELRVRRFVEGLRWEIREFVEMRDIPNLEKATEYARVREEAIKLKNAELVPSLKRSRSDFQPSQSFNRSAQFGRNFSNQSSARSFSNNQAREQF